jgi:hypothetical protein
MTTIFRVIGFEYTVRPGPLGTGAGWDDAVIVDALELSARAGGGRVATTPVVVRSSAVPAS